MWAANLKFDFAVADDAKAFFQRSISSSRKWPFIRFRPRPTQMSSHVVNSLGYEQLRQVSSRSVFVAAAKQDEKFAVIHRAADSDDLGA